MQQIIIDQNRKITLIETTCLLSESVAEIRAVIEEKKPSIICLELCSQRYENLLNQEQWQGMNIMKIIRENKVGLLITHLILDEFQKQIEQSTQIKIDETMYQTLLIANELQIPFALIDRDISITMRRVWKILSGKEKINLITSFLNHLFNPTNKINDFVIEDLKVNDLKTQLIKQFSEKFPSIKTILIDERNQYLAEKIKSIKGEHIIVVVGAGQFPGIMEAFHQQHDLQKLEEIPQPKILSKFFKWIIPFSVIGIIIYGFLKVDVSVSLEMIQRWILANGILSALGALIAGGHILTVITAFIAAPITSLNPAIAAGWVSGFVEAWIRKPTVNSFENLKTDIASFQGIRKNAITRILIVTILSNIGSAIGTFIGIPLVALLL